MQNVKKQQSNKKSSKTKQHKTSPKTFSHVLKRTQNFLEMCNIYKVPDQVFILSWIYPVLSPDKTSLMIRLLHYP